MSCEHCKSAIEAAVGRIPGVARVEADVEASVVTVDHDPGAADVGSIANAIEREGYSVAERRGTS